VLIGVQTLHPNYYAQTATNLIEFEKNVNVL